MKAAVELIAEHGYHAMSLEAVGKRAGYSRGLVSHRFGSKEGLVRMLVQRMLAQWNEARRDPALQGRSGLEAVQSIVSAHGAALREAPQRVQALYRLMFESHGELEPLREDFARIDREQRELVVGLLRAAQKQGAVRQDVEADTYAVLLLGTLRGIVMQWLIAPEVVDLARVYAQLHVRLAADLAAPRRTPRPRR
jgi:AcrR family transcriptional regulator